MGPHDGPDGDPDAWHPEIPPYLEEENRDWRITLLVLFDIEVETKELPK